jgi:ribosome-binding ATPase YchF (GTP1/OBG family)
MLVGIVGKPNSGKSTFFSAATHVDAKIANYPFTTIEPNKGVGYATRPCPCSILHVKCNPQDSACANGTRMIPVQLLDVAGIVPDAHSGKGLGLRFLDDMRQAEGIIIVVDASGETDLEGNPGDCDPSKEVELIETELREWIKEIILRNRKDYENRDSAKLAETLSSLNMNPDRVAAMLEKHGIDRKKVRMDDETASALADSIVKDKPMLVFGNKADKGKKEINCSRPVVYGSGAYEHALGKAAKAGVIEYLPGSDSFSIKNGTDEQKAALSKIAEFMKANSGTGVTKALNEMVFGLLGYITAYPVEDEHKYSDSKGNVLPNVKLVRKGGTAHDLAATVHTDIANGMLYAIDAKTKMKAAKDHIIKDADVIKIVSASRKRAAGVIWMERNIFALCVMAVVVAAVLAGCVGNGAVDAKLAAFNESINRYIGIVNSTGDYHETISMGSNVSAYVFRNGDEFNITRASEINNWIVIRKNGTEYLCLEFKGKKECTSNITLLGGSTSAIVSSLEGLLLSETQAGLISTRYNGLMRHGSLSVENYSKGPDSRTFYINYSLKDLTGRELAALYLSPTSPYMSIGAFVEMMEFRDSDGMRMGYAQAFEYQNMTVMDHYSVTGFSADSGSIAAPESANDTNFKTLFSGFATFWNAYVAVSSPADYRSVAIQFRMPSLCSKTGDFAGCIDAYTAMAQDANACPLLSGDEKDRCWYYFGKTIGKSNQSYCGMIGNATLKAECMANATINYTPTQSIPRSNLTEWTAQHIRVENGTWNYINGNESCEINKNGSAASMDGSEICFGSCVNKIANTTAEQFVEPCNFQVPQNQSG